MRYDRRDFYRTLSNEELQGVIRRMEALAAVTKSSMGRRTAMSLAKAASEVIEERQGQ